MPGENRPLIPNSTQIPNVILDLVIPEIPEAEGKCLFYICRRTFGFHREKDRISFNQFIFGIKTRDGKVLDKGTGLSRPAVSEALRNLIKSEAIFVQESSRGNIYKINLDMDVEAVVKNIKWLRKLTRTSKESKPKQVKLLN